MRKGIWVHGGKEEKVSKDVEGSGLTREALLAEVHTHGGRGWGVILYTESWVREMKSSGCGRWAEGPSFKYAI